MQTEATHSVAAGAIPCVPLCLGVPAALLAGAVPFVPLRLRVALISWGRCRDRRLWRVPVASGDLPVCSANRSVCAACISADTKLSSRMCLSSSRIATLVCPVRFTSPSKVKMRRASGVCIAMSAYNRGGRNAPMYVKPMGTLQTSSVKRRVRRGSTSQWAYSTRACLARLSGKTRRNAHLHVAHAAPHCGQGLASTPWRCSQSDACPRECDPPASCASGTVHQVPNDLPHWNS